MIQCSQQFLPHQILFESSISLPLSTIQDGASGRGLIAALDIDSGALVAEVTLPSYCSLTSTNLVVAGGAGEDVLGVAWNLTDSTTMVYHLHLNYLNRTLMVMGQSPPRNAETTPDIYPSLSFGPGAGQVLAAYGSSASVYEGLVRPPCVWGQPIKNAYIAHCCDDGCIPYVTIDGAQSACSASLACFGITSDPGTGTWTLRGSPSTGPSPTGEESFLILNPSLCHAL